jgi:hypothetical protein
MAGGLQIGPATDKANLRWRVSTAHSTSNLPDRKLEGKNAFRPVARVSPREDRLRLVRGILSGEMGGRAPAIPTGKGERIAVSRASNPAPDRPDIVVAVNPT